ncbi:hypothetical protein D3C73_1179200 [compost metagenome]
MCHLHNVQVVDVRCFDAQSSVGRLLLQPSLDFRLGIAQRHLRAVALKMNDQLGFGNINTDDEIARFHCHGLHSRCMVFRLEGFHQEAQACFYRR